VGHPEVALERWILSVFLNCLEGLWYKGKKHIIGTKPMTESKRKREKKIS
jgi:hypothetical protein